MLAADGSRCRLPAREYWRGGLAEGWRLGVGWPAEMGVGRDGCRQGFDPSGTREESLRRGIRGNRQGVGRFELWF